MNANIAGRLIALARDHPERTAIVATRHGRTRSISFESLSRRVEALAAAMRTGGVQRGDPVLLFVPMSIDLYVTLLATLHAGAVCLFVDAWANRSRLEAAVALARPELLIAPAPVHLLRLFSPSLRRIPRTWTVGSARRASTSREGGGPPAELTAEAPALITFTTGSTGTPKAAVRSHGLLWAQHEALAQHLQLGSGDVDLPTLPIFVLNNLALGVTSVIPDFDPRKPAKIRPRRIVRQIHRHGVTTTSGSPAFYAALTDWCLSRRVRLEVRLWTGGAPVYPPLARRLDAATGGGAHVVYGSTEAEPIAGIGAGEMVRVMEETPQAQGICCGRPVPQVHLRIIRAADAPVVLRDAGWSEWEVEPGEVGEIVVSGEHVIGEYLHAPEETLRHKVREGSRVWHRTGDAGRLDGEGRLWLMGRVSTRVIRRGETWWSAPAEVRALRVPGVRHAAYFGVPREGAEQEAVLAVEAAPAAELTRHLRESLGPIPVDVVHVLDRIPRDPRHESKTDLERLRTLLAKGR